MSRIGLAGLLVLAILTAGCSPGSLPSSISAYDTVLTLFSDKADFTGARTFTLVDSIVHLVDPGGSDTISRQYDGLVLTRVRDNMIAAGWTEISNPSGSNPPDVAIQVAATTSDNYVVEYWPPYWGWYPGWGYPGYGWGWGWSNVYKYTTGTVLMAMLDLRNPDTGNETVPVMWLGALNGVLSSSTSVQARIVDGIDQAFEQSPYLRK